MARPLACVAALALGVLLPLPIHADEGGARVYSQAMAAMHKLPFSDYLPYDLVTGSGNTLSLTIARSKAGDISVAGIEGGDTPVVHVKMRAVNGDTDRYPLTDMFVDAKSNLIRALIFGGGRRGLISGEGGSGRFDFGPVGKYWLLQHVHIEGSGHVLFMEQGGHMDMNVQNYAFPTTCPEVLCQAPAAGLPKAPKL